MGPGGFGPRDTKGGRALKEKQLLNLKTETQMLGDGLAFVPVAVAISQAHVHVHAQVKAIWMTGGLGEGGAASILTAEVVFGRRGEDGQNKGRGAGCDRRDGF